MGAFVVYILEWSACLLGFLLLFKMCFSGSTFHRFNRFYLLGSVVLSAILPLIHISMSEQVEPVAEACRTVAIAEESPLNGLSIESAMDTDTESLTTTEKGAIALLVIYVMYILLQLTGWCKSFFKMLRFMHGKRRRRVGKWIWLLEHNSDYGPFSWMNFIFIPANEMGFGRRASMRHELSHIVLLHHLDLVFLMICVIINPTCWIVMKEIKIVHEYEADNEVINHYRIQLRDYQRLLIMRTVGAEAYALASSFNLNIKKRIIMMKKKQSHWWRMIWIAVTIPLIGFTLMAFSKPKEVLKEVVDNTVRVIEQPIAEMMNAEVADSESVPVMEESEVSQTADESQPLTPDVKPGEIITGEVSGQNGEPLQLANIVEIDEYGRVLAHAQTDANGRFTLKVVDSKHKLRFSYVGYKTKTLDIGGEEMDVVLEQAMQLTDVQVVAHRAVAADADSSRYQEHAYPNEDGVFQVVEQAPKYPGEIEGIMIYLSRNLQYPSVAREMQVEAGVVVRFTVDKTGLVRSPQVVNVNAQTPLVTAEMAKAAKEGNPDAVEALKNYYDAIDALKEEAIHVVRNMPRWEPGRQNGKRIDTTYTLPINFKLQ